jgi:hypothetical protein
VSALYVYALLGRNPRGPLGTGLRGQPLRVVRCGAVFAAVSPMETAPLPIATALRRHDATVRQLAAAADAILPVRFGSLVSSEADLSATLGRHAVELRAALSLVGGREQVTLRVYGEPKRVQTPADLEGGAELGPGARYLRGRARARDRACARPPRSTGSGLPSHRSSGLSGWSGTMRHHCW